MPTGYDSLLLPLPTESAHGCDGANALFSKHRHLIENVAKDEHATPQGCHRRSSPTNSLHGPSHLSSLAIGTECGQPRPDHIV